MTAPTTRSRPVWLAAGDDRLALEQMWLATVIEDIYADILDPPAKAPGSVGTYCAATGPRPSETGRRPRASSTPAQPRRPLYHQRSPPTSWTSSCLPPSPGSGSDGGGHE